jgi:hypothetical protein
LAAVELGLQHPFEEVAEREFLMRGLVCNAGILGSDAVELQRLAHRDDPIGLQVHRAATSAS